MSLAQELLPTTEVERKQILELYNTTEEQIKEDIELIKKWKEMQPHLPEKISDDFIGRILIKNKCRVERTKQKLDNYFSLRGHNQDLIRNFENVVPTKCFITYLPLPKLSPKFERIIVMRWLNVDPNVYNMTDLVTLNLAVTELSLLYDDSIGVRYLFDFEGFSLKHLIKWNPMLITKHLNLIRGAYSNRMLGIDIFNFPEFATKILAVMKIILSEKLYNRITIHKDLDSLYKVMPKECLPVEYNGTFGTLPEMLGKWDELMKNHRNFFIESYNNISVEHLRPLEVAESENFGLDGTFKKLTID